MSTKKSEVESTSSTEVPEVKSTEPPRETVVVVGAGLAGALSAIFLAKAGYQVMLIEKQPRPMMVSSKIPVHLHSGGLYTGDAAVHCLHDSINFRQVLPFAVTERPTAFAVMTLDDKTPRASGMTLLEEEAKKLFDADAKAGKVNPQGWALYKEQYKGTAAANQLKKWDSMQAKFAMLQGAYATEVTHDPGRAEFGTPSDFYRSYNQAEFMAHGLTAKTLATDPPLADKDEWTKQLARVSDPEEVVGVVMSSEVGLNMMRAGAGIENELEQLKEQRKLSFLTGVWVKTIERNANGVMLLTCSDGKQIAASQVVNATGYRGKDMDMQMGVQTDWAVDVKGAGVISFNGENFNHVPEVFFTEGIGMSHLSRFNYTMAGINYCDPEVEATYVKGGKIEYKVGETLDSREALGKLEADILGKSVTDPTLLARTQRDIDGCARFMPTLPASSTPCAYVAGALGLIGGLDTRTSKEVYHTAEGYHAVNLSKGGGCVSTAMALVDAVEKHSIAKGARTEESRHFAKGSHSEIPPDFRLSGTYPGHTLDSTAQERATQMEVDSRVAQAYSNA